MNIFTQFLPDWSEDVTTEFEVSSMFNWEDNLQQVEEIIKSNYDNVVTSSGETWFLTKVEKYQSSDSSCQFDWFLIARYSPNNDSFDNGSFD